MAKVVSKWNQHIEHFPYSPLEFLTCIRDTIERQQLRFVKIGAIFHGRGRSGKRIYLRVYHRQYYIDIGAAPYGEGFFVSVWLFEKELWKNLKEDFAKSFLWIGRKLGQAPYTGKFGEWGAKQMYDALSPRNPENQDVYHQDELSMFHHNIKQIVSEIIKEMGGEYGMRQRYDH